VTHPDEVNSALLSFLNEEKKSRSTGLDRSQNLMRLAGLLALLFAGWVEEIVSRTYRINRRN